MGLALLLLGLMRFNFNVSKYVWYLNTVDTSEVTRNYPSSIVDVFVPGEEMVLAIEEKGNLLIQTGAVIGSGVMWTGSATGDAGFQDFFWDFNAKDFATVDQNAQFGFSGDMSSAATTTGDQPTIETVLTNDQKQMLLQRLQSRKDRELTPSQVMTGKDDN